MAPKIRVTERASEEPRSGSQQRVGRRACGTKTVELKWWVVEWRNSVSAWHPIAVNHPSLKRAEAAMKRLARKELFAGNMFRVVGVEVVERKTVLKEVQAGSPTEQS